MILRGDRNLTVAHIRKLADHFRVSPELLIREPPSDQEPAAGIASCLEGFCRVGFWNSTGTGLGRGCIPDKDDRRGSNRWSPCPATRGV